MRARQSWGVGIVMIAVLGVAAQRLAGATQAASPPPQQGVSLVEHPDHVQPGLASHARWANLTNPYAGDTQRAAEGAKLFVSYNCMDCHGADGSGAMGPSLQDGRMHFG